MTIQVKICGVSDDEALAAAVEGGAQYVGFNFYPPSRRFIEGAVATSLLATSASSILSVGLFVDPSDEDIKSILKTVSLRMLQLHGDETPARVAYMKELFGLPVIKAIGIASVQDIAKAKTYEAVADMLLLDAKPAQGLKGGAGKVFDWSLIKGVSFARPWLLAGGLDESNIGAAVAATGARILDVSSGVEDACGRKSASKIKAFLAKAKQL